MVSNGIKQVVGLFLGTPKWGIIKKLWVILEDFYNHFISKQF